MGTLPHIVPYLHRCIIQSGDMAGSENYHEVVPFEVEYRVTCDECGELLATVEQITAHIYNELLGI